ncbi:MAG: single-stranded DNA-binding protein [Patescibacteria group bacterium]
MDLNKVMLIGRLTKDPEMRTTPSGQQVASFSMATNRYYNDPAGQRQEKVEFHNVTAWGKLAEICSQYLGKGRRAYIEGRLQTRDWVGQDGVKRYSTDIVAENLIMLDAPSGTGGGNGGTRPMASQPTATRMDNQGEVVEEEHTLETIPF